MIRRRELLGETRFTRIDYIESDGFQYIDTGFTATGGCIVEYEGTFLESSCVLVGSHNVSSGTNGWNRNYLASDNGNSFQAAKCDNMLNISRSDLLDTKHVYYHNTIGTNNIAKIDGVTVVDETTTQTLNPENSINVFRLHYNNALSRGRIYWLKIYESNSVLVRDFIPVRVGSEGYLYDRLSGVLYGNMGTGRFILSTYEEMGYVDLGLSVLWAKGNICKDSNRYYIGNPTDYGCYYSWGNVTGHNVEEGYNFNQATYNSTAGASITTDIVRSDPTQDAARACLGKGNMTPTWAEMSELINNCTVTEVAGYNGIDGYGRVFKSNVEGYTNREIFFPYAGYCDGTPRYGANSYGDYWNSVYKDSTNAYGMQIQMYDARLAYFERRYGFPVRAVHTYL